jgi:hypothetical protein
MQKTILSVALTVLIGTSAAFAQGGTTTVPKNNPEARPIPQAPIGHRQPRRDEVPDANIADQNNPKNKEDAALDRKIKSICRGC